MGKELLFKPVLITEFPKQALTVSQISDVAWKVNSKIECVGACQTESPKCNSVFFDQQTPFCGLANLLGSYNAGISVIGNLAYVQVGI